VVVVVLLCGVLCVVCWGCWVFKFVWCFVGVGSEIVLRGFLLGFCFGV